MSTIATPIALSSNMAQPSTASVQPEPSIFKNGMLQHFHLFDALPTETRLQIFRTAAKVERIIEIEPAPGGVNNFRVSARTSQAPALMHVNREARDELQRIFQGTVYEKTTFHAPAPAGAANTTPYIWYNPYCDIVLLGAAMSDACVRKFFAGFRNRHTSILTKVAVTTINTNYQMSHALIRSHRYTPRAGCPDIEELFVIIESDLWKYEVDSSGNGLHFRPALHRGSTKEAQRNLTMLDSNYAISRNPHLGGSFIYTKWAAPNKLKLTHVCLAPKPLPGVGQEQYQAVQIHRDTNVALRRQESGPMLMKGQDDTGCSLALCGDTDEDHTYALDVRGWCEMGFFGSADAIEACQAHFSSTELILPRRPLGRLRAGLLSNGQLYMHRSMFGDN